MAALAAGSPGRLWSHRSRTRELRFLSSEEKVTKTGGKGTRTLWFLCFVRSGDSTHSLRRSPPAAGPGPPGAHTQPSRESARGSTRPPPGVSTPHLPSLDVVLEWDQQLQPTNQAGPRLQHHPREEGQDRPPTRGPGTGGARGRELRQQADRGQRRRSDRNRRESSHRSRPPGTGRGLATQAQPRPSPARVLEVLPGKGQKQRDVRGRFAREKGEWNKQGRQRPRFTELRPRLWGEAPHGTERAGPRGGR